MGHHRRKCVIQLQWDIIVGSVLFNCSGTSALVVCYSITVEHQRWKCVIQLQWDVNVGSVLFNYNGTSSLVVCYSIEM